MSCCAAVSSSSLRSRQSVAPPLPRAVPAARWSPRTGMHHLPPCGGAWCLFLHFGPQGFEQAIIGSIGNLGWVGCNRHGLAFVNNDLMLAPPRPGLPSQVVRRMILGEPRPSPRARVFCSRASAYGRTLLSARRCGGRRRGRRGLSAPSACGSTRRKARCCTPTTRSIRRYAGDEDAAVLQRDLSVQPPPAPRACSRGTPPAFSVSAIAALLADRDGFPDACRQGRLGGGAERHFVLRHLRMRRPRLCISAPARLPTMRISRS